MLVEVSTALNKNRKEHQLCLSKASHENRSCSSGNRDLIFPKNPWSYRGRERSPAKIGYLLRFCFLRGVEFLFPNNKKHFVLVEVSAALHQNRK